VRLFEGLIFGVILIALIVRTIPALRKLAVFTYLPFLAGKLIFVQLAVEGYRWQMVPIYTITGLFILVSLLHLNRMPENGLLVKRKGLRFSSLVAAYLGFVLALVFPLALPVVNLPQPSGSYPVGTTNFRLVDESRQEIFTENPTDVRNLAVRVWYPAERVDGLPLATYWDRKGETGRIYSLNADMGTFWYTHLSRVKTNSRLGAPVSGQERKFPVIIYSPSFYGMNTENTMLFEELASQGYIVFSIAHTIETIASVYPDGEILPGNYEYISTLFDSNAEQEKQLYLDYRTAETEKQKAEIAVQILTVDEEAVQLVKVRTADVLFVLDELERMNGVDELFGSRLNLDQVGVMGWSFGGGTAIEALIADSRFKAGINIDGWPYGERFNTGKMIHQPFMLVRSVSEDDVEDVVTSLLEKQLAGPAYVYQIKNAAHTNFWDFTLFFEIYQYLGYWDSIDAQQLLTVEGTYIVGFFNQYLKGSGAPLPGELQAP